MQAVEQPRMHPEIRELIAEATQALARLEADRLEELALSCQVLNRDLAELAPGRRASIVRQSREAARDMAVFARVLDATRANLQVMKRLREIHMEHLEYGEQIVAGSARAPAESGYGDN